MPHKLIRDLKKLEDKKQAEILQRFFKTGKGQYGEGDIFLGIKVPIQRKVCKGYGDLSLEAIQKLLDSRIHEHRLCGLFVLVSKYKKSNKIQKGKIFKFYLKNAKKVNNWDLVDLSAPNIVGDYLLENPEIKKILEKLANSKNLWEKRISIVSTWAFIRKEKYLEDVLKISHILLKDKHDLIHKAVGWMLRELGKKDLLALECFIRTYYKDMPRTMLRYAIEKFPEKKRKAYLKGKW
jgi:3-methyladenine DNA glycosylase AlkD